MGSGYINTSYHDPLKFRRIKGKIMNREDWKRFVKDAYLWIDYISIPNVENSLSFPLVDENGEECGDMKILSYIKRSDLMIILSPPMWRREESSLSTSKRFSKPMLFRTFVMCKNNFSISSYFVLDTPISRIIRISPVKHRYVPRQSLVCFGTVCLHAVA